MSVYPEMILVAKSSRTYVLDLWIDPGFFMLFDLKLFMCMMTWVDGSDADHSLSSFFIDILCSGK
jgi:hypothetical protein